MKRIIPFLLSVSLLYSCHQEEEISLPTDGPVINLAELGLSENDVVQGRMRIKLKEEPAGNLSEKSIEGGISARIKNDRPFCFCIENNPHGTYFSSCREI